MTAKGPAPDFQAGAVYAASRLVVDADRVYAPGAVAVAGGVVLVSGPRDQVLGSVPASYPVREFPGEAILPGLVNAHTHLQIPRFAGATGEPPAPHPSFVDWLLQVILWRLQADPSSFAGNFRSAAAEALSCGVTTVGEIAGPDLSVYASSPVRARVFAEGIGFAPDSAPAVLEAVREAVRLLEEAAASNPLIAPGVSPHTLYSVGKELLHSLGELAASKKLPACLHLAESAAETEFLESGSGEIASRLFPALGQDVSRFRGIGRSVPEYLAEAGLLRPGLLLAHNVHLAVPAIDALRKGGARFVLCPRSNAGHGNGAPNVTYFVDAGIPFALGTDSAASVPTLDLWEEIRLARSLYKGVRYDPGLCRELLKAATANGTAALSLPGGILAQGSPADFTVVDDPGGSGCDFFRNLVDRTGRSNVRLTVVAGRTAYESTA